MEHDDENTPAKVQFGPREYQVLLDKLTGISAVCVSITGHQVTMIHEIRTVAAEQVRLSQRVTVLEASQKWIPLALSILAIANSAYNSILIHALSR